MELWVNPRVAGDDLTADDLRREDAVRLVATGAIARGDEVIVSYGSKYDFLFDEVRRGGRASGGVLRSRSAAHTLASM